jgi:hypothetical protein
MSTRIAKKSTSTRKQVVRRNGQRESKTEIVIEEEEDVNDSENESENGVPAEGGDSQQMSEGQSQSQSQSQSQGDNQLEKMITDMMQTASLHHVQNLSYN